jgi:hypothetical protein
MAYGVAALGFGAGIGLAALGLAQLATSMSALSNEQVLAFGLVAGAILATMAAGIFVLGKSSLAASPGLAIFAGVIVAVGGGIALAAWGLSLFATALAGVTPEQIGALTKLVGTMLLFGAAAPFLVISALGFTAAAGSVFLLGQALKTIDVTALENMAKLVEHIRGITTDNVITFVAVNESIKSVFSAASESADSGGGAVLESAAKTVGAAVGAGGKGGGGSGGSTSINITLELDKKPIQNFIIDVVNDKAKLRKTN